MKNMENYKNYQKEYNRKRWQTEEYQEYQKEYQQRYYKEHPETSEKSFKKFYCTLNGRATHMLNNCKNRAKKHNLPFDLDKEFILNKLEAGVCEITGIPFEIKINGGKGHKDNSFSPSVDRKDNTKGYTKDNIQIVCWIYNRAKGAFPIEDLEKIINALKNKKLI